MTITIVVAIRSHVVIIFSLGITFFANKLGGLVFQNFLNSWPKWLLHNYSFFFHRNSSSQPKVTLSNHGVLKLYLTQEDLPMLGTIWWSPNYFFRVCHNLGIVTTDSQIVERALAALVKLETNDVLDFVEIELSILVILFDMLHHVEKTHIVLPWAWGYAHETSVFVNFIALALDLFVQIVEVWLEL